MATVTNRGRSQIQTTSKS